MKCSYLTTLKINHIKSINGRKWKCISAISNNGINIYDSQFITRDLHFWRWRMTWKALRFSVILSITNKPWNRVYSNALFEARWFLVIFAWWWTTNGLTLTTMIIWWMTDNEFERLFSVFEGRVKSTQVLRLQKPQNLAKSFK